MKTAPRKYSLPFRILTASFILLVIPLLIFAAFEMKSSYEERLRDAKNNLINISKQKMGELAQVTSSKMLLLEKIGYLLDIPKRLPDLPNKQTDHILEELVQTGGIWGIGIHKITLDGRFINVGTHDPFYAGKDWTDLYRVMDVLNKKRVTIFNVDKQIPHAELFLTSMLIESDHKPIGSFTMAFDVTDVLKDLLAPIDTPYRLNFALVTRFKVVFEASDPDLRWQLFQPLSPEMRDFLNRSLLYADYTIAEKPLQITHIPESPFFEFEFKGKKQLAYEIGIPHSKTVIVAYVTKEAITLQILEDFIPVFAVFCLIFLFGGCVVFLITHLMAEPFLKLALCLEDVKNNNYQTRYQQSPVGFEINYLGEIFNEMLLSMRKYMQRAEDERAKREAVAQELKIGHDVQRQILPQNMPSYPKIEIADCFISAKEVSGDFYDVFIQEAPEGKKLFFTVADTSGKGISACLYSLGVRSLIKGFGREMTELSPLVYRINKNFYEAAGNSGMFVTAFIGTFDQHTEQLTYISCGHNPAFIKRKNGSVELLENHGMALGFKENLDLKEKNMSLREGDILILYTGGITEARDENKELFGLEGLMTFFKEQSSERTAQEMAQALMKRIEEFTSSSMHYDDMTLLIVKRTSE